MNKPQRHRSSPGCSRFRRTRAEQSTCREIAVGGGSRCVAAGYRSSHGCAVSRRCCQGSRRFLQRRLHCDVSNQYDVISDAPPSQVNRGGVKSALRADGQLIASCVRSARSYPAGYVGLSINGCGRVPFAILPRSPMDAGSRIDGCRGLMIVADLWYAESEIG